MSLRLKLFTPLLLLALLLGLYLRQVWMPDFLTQEQSHALAQARAHLDTLGDALLPSLLMNDLAEVYATTDQVVSELDTWVQLTLKDKKGSILYPLDKPKRLSSSDFIAIELPIRHGNEAVAQLKLWLDKDALLMATNAQLDRLSWLVLAGLLLFFVIAAAVTEWFVRRPVSHLSRASDRMAKGDFSVSLPRSGKDEVGRLVQSFEAMRHAVKAARLAADQELKERNRTQHSLELKNRQITEILENTTDAYLTLDADWRLTYSNPRVGELLRFDAEAAMGQVIWDELPELSSFFYKSLKKVESTGQAIGFEGYYPPFNIWLELHAYPVNEGITVYLRDISERKRADQALRDSELQQRAILANMVDGLLTIDSAGLLRSMNSAAEQIFACTAAEFTGTDICRLIPDYRQLPHLRRINKYLDKTVPTGSRIVELTGRRADDTQFPMECALGEMRSQGQTLFVLTVRDITLRKQVETNLRLADQVFESSLEGIIITDAENRVLRINQAFTDITGYTQEEMVGKTPTMLSSGKHDADYYRSMWESLNTHNVWQGEVWNRRKDGEVFPEALSISVVRDPAGEITNYVGVFADVTEKKRAEERIRHMANYDPLTNLANRTLYNDRLNQSLLHAQRSGELLVVMYLDLDRFKNINDTLGHPAGDQVLKTVASRLQLALREEDTLARIGGDEFTILMTGDMSERDVARIAENLLREVARPQRLDGRELFVTASIGIALYPHDAQTIDDLIKNADAALYHAKQLGRNGYQFYTLEMNASALERFTLESELRRALEREEFILYYQPQIDIESGQIIGAETLIRWQHHSRGLVSPAAFIPLLEETGLIVPVGEWVLRHACRQAVKWQQAGLAPLRIAVNISPLQFKIGNVVTTVRKVLSETGLSAEYLELEITEGSLMGDLDDNIARLRELKEMGIHLAIDDFGTGFSSLSYLKRFPIDVLKIDQSFVRDVTTDPDDAAITTAVISLGHNLGLKVVAEGVETQRQLEFLHGYGCDIAQGYLISRPVPAAGMRDMMVASASGPVRLPASG